MKKIATILALAFCVTLIACSDNSSTNTPDDTPEDDYFKATANGSSFSALMLSVSGGPDTYAVTANNGTVVVSASVPATTGTTEAKNGFSIFYSNAGTPTFESATEGSIVVTKVTATQIKGTFTAKTPAYNFTNGSFVINKD